MQDASDPGDTPSSVSPQPDAPQDPGATEDAATPSLAKEAWSAVGRLTADPPADIADVDASSAPRGHVDQSKPEGMPDPDHARSLAETLDLLRVSVRELIARDRRTTAAAVSLEMRNRTHNSFSPANAGFSKFRDFLHFAEQVGAVTLLQPRQGGDVEVFPVSAATDSSATVSPQQARAVRRDLWQAFVDWSPKWRRVFDTQTDRIIKVLASPEEGDAESTGPRLWEKDPIRYRQIVPLTQDDQIDWIRDFVGQLEPGREREVLSATLGDSHPIAAFVEAITDLPEYRKAWRQTFSRHVTTRITEWVLEQHLTIDIYQQPASHSNSANAGRSGLALERAQC